MAEPRTYWLDLFTGTTWDEFRKAGACVTGFNHRMRKTVESIRSGDILLCYLTGVKRWVGALEVQGRSKNAKKIWKDADYPERLEVKHLIVLDAEFGLPMESLEGKVDFLRGPADRTGLRAFVRRSPNKFKDATDGPLILKLLTDIQSNPIRRPVDPKKLARKPFYSAIRRAGKQQIETVVSVPDSQEDESLAAECPADGDKRTTRHTEIQYRLLQLGTQMGFDVWVARNDRSKLWQGKAISSLPNLVDELPTQFNEVTNKTIELIDVLWLKGNSIIAAFEVECTTAIYSGLLRMSDLLALQPNLEIHLYLVAPDERRDKVEQEILRPTFALREKPLSKICGFLGFSLLSEKMAAIENLGLASSLKPDFLQKTAEYFRPDA